MTSPDQYASARTLPARSPVSPAGPARDPAKLLLRRLYRLYAAERQLAFDLPRLFRQSTALSLRLALSDQRKETSRQLVRLESIIQTSGGDTAMSPTGRLVDAHSDGDFTRGAPTHAIATAALAQARVTIAGYGSAITLAKRLRMLSMVDLLTESLSEKRRMTAVLAPFTVQPE